jgi:hypothetical protein
MMHPSQGRKRSLREKPKLNVIKKIEEATMGTEERFLVTVILRHDQSKTLDEITEHCKKTGFYRDFPPEGTELVSWVVAMSFGFIIQLLVKPEGLRSLNRFMEQKAWGAFRYEVYPAYDFRPIAEKFKKDHS